VESSIPVGNPVIDSVTSVWKGADWLERETYDLLGIEFKGHPDLRRIMLTYSIFKSVYQPLLLLVLRN